MKPDCASVTLYSKCPFYTSLYSVKCSFLVLLRHHTSDNDGRKTGAGHGRQRGIEAAYCQLSKRVKERALKPAVSPRHGDTTTHTLTLNPIDLFSISCLYPASNQTLLGLHCATASIQFPLSCCCFSSRS